MPTPIPKEILENQVTPCKESIDLLVDLIATSDSHIDKDSQRFKEMQNQIESIYHLFYVLIRELDYYNGIDPIK